MIAGPDGVGKSTLAKALAARVSRDRRALIFHQRPSVLPTRTNRPVVDPHGDPPYTRAISVWKALYLVVDVTLAWFLKVRPFVKSGGWILIERGWWDIAVDPARYRIALPYRRLRSLVSRLPQPDLMVILEVPTGEIQRRKAELSIEELERQRAAWREVRPATKVVYLDGTLPVSALVCRVLEEVQT